jgi:predicted Zn-dependent protease
MQSGGKSNPNDEIIDEIVTSKKEIAPENPKQKEQIDLINQFIKTAPSISSARERQVPPSGDLNNVKSGEFGDNVVSETLVEILVKQGKKEKAIEVLKKLIWKYPQKKTYFASQIEDLKK